MNSFAPLTSIGNSRATGRNRSGLRSLAALLWRRRLVICFVTVLVAATIAVGLTMAQREYTATARVAATPPPELSQSPASYNDLLGTMANVAESAPLLQQVSEETGAGPVDELRDQVSGAVVPGTVIIQVSVTDPDPDRAARVANAVVQALPEHDPSNGAFVFHITESAEVPTSFSSPNIPVTVLAGIVLIVVLAIGAALLADRLTRTVDDAEDAHEASGTAVLGVLPRPSDPTGLPAKEPDLPEFQALRSLRVAIEFASSEQPTRVLVVAPAVFDPWGGWLEVNMAVALAEVGHRVLLVDACRESGARHPALGDAGTAGLYDVLGGTLTLDRAVRHGPSERVDVLALGNAELAAPSLLEMRIKQMIEQTTDRYDVVVVRAGSVSTSEDARIMAIHGALLLTVPTGRIHPRGLHRVAEHLRMIRIRLLGTAVVGAKGARGA